MGLKFSVKNKKNTPRKDKSSLKNMLAPKRAGSKRPMAKINLSLSCLLKSGLNTIERRPGKSQKIWVLVPFLTPSLYPQFAQL